MNTQAVHLPQGAARRKNPGPRIQPAAPDPRAAEGDLTMLDYTKTWLAVRGIHLFNDKRGVTALEYGLIATLIAVAIIAGVTTLGKSLNNTFSSVSGNL